MADPPLTLDLILVGGGHAHVYVLKMLGMHRQLWQSMGIQVTLIAKDVHTPYSGMLPGFVSGHYSQDEIHLDLNRLARFAGARLVVAAAEKITYDDKGGGGLVYVNGERPPLRYDCLSVNIGSAPDNAMQSNQVIPVKPIANFCRYLDGLLEKWDNMVDDVRSKASANGSSRDETAYTIGVVGGGAGGIEILLSLQYRLQSQSKSKRPLQMVLVTKSRTIMNSHNRGVQRVFERILRQRGVILHYGAHVRRVEPTKDGKKRLVLDTEQSTCTDDIVIDDVVWCITAGVAKWLQVATPFATTPQGFLRVDDTYQSISHPGVFGAGDCIHMDPHPRPKAGVFAVRAGPYLHNNLLSYLLQDRPLRQHRPQKEFLGIISTGDPRGVASKGWWFCLEGAWIWKWKDYIDRKWMRMYTDLPDMEEMKANMSASGFDGSQSLPTASDFLRAKGDDVMELFTKDPMRCGGCGAKVGASTVSRVLDALYERQVERADRLGLPAPAPIDHDDAALLPIPSQSGAMVQTIDYFRNFLTDTYEFGRIAAVHALSDVHAMGAEAQSALILAVALFAADEAITEHSLLSMICGVSDVLQDEDVRIVGGHTCEGKELACGLSVQGYAAKPGELFRKRGGKVGDMIVLTKPVGTGALFAADMRARAMGRQVVEAISSMGKSNVVASRIAVDQPKGVIHGCTDVTGFGLIGHLIEMLVANDVDASLESIGAVLRMSNVPFLAGGLEASSCNIFSSLQSQNANNRRAVANHSEAAERFPIEYPLLFDPQTAGGLMFLVDPTYATSFVDELRSEQVDAHVIGEIVPYPENEAAALAESTCAAGVARTGLRIRIGD